MHVVKFSTVEPYEPAGHFGVVNRMLAGRGEGAVEAVSVWHGLLDPGGGAETHVHEHSVQIYVCMAGSVEVEVPTGKTVLERGDTAILDPGEPHAVLNRYPNEPAELLVISSPALR